MSGGRPAAELWESVRLLRTELWLFLGGIGGFLGYGLWVLATGAGVTGAVPFLGQTVVTTVAGIQLDALTLFAILAWFVLPALVTVSLVQRKLTNPHGNLASQYRLNHPSVLLALPGIVLLGCLGATVVLGQSPLLAGIAFVASIHLFVRTIAYGHRVYTLSYPRVFWSFAFLTAGLLAFGWLVQATLASGVDARVSSWLTTGSVDVVVETLLTALGLTPGQLLTRVIAIPALLSVCYLVPQILAGLFVRNRAPLANPTKRAGQRYPIMPPRAQSTGSAATGAVATDGSTPVVEQDSDNTPADADSTESGDKSGTRVFVPDQPVPDPETVREGDEWIDDTDVFSTDQKDSAPERCPACQTDLSEKPSASFCPDCGEQLV